MKKGLLPGSRLLLLAVDPDRGRPRQCSRRESSDLMFASRCCRCVPLSRASKVLDMRGNRR